MKPLPADTEITNFEFPLFEAPAEDTTSPLANVPHVEGFAPFDPANPTAGMTDTVPVVQPAIFQDFKKVVPQP